LVRRGGLVTDRPGSCVMRLLRAALTKIAGLFYDSRCSETGEDSMRIVVTGATSFVGVATVNELLNRGHEVFAVVRPDSQKLDRLQEQERLKIIENDLSEPQLLPEKIKTPCDVFCHFGWGGSGSDARTNRGLQEKNLEDAVETIYAAKKLGCSRFIFSGSQAEYGLHKTLMHEEISCEPRSLYGEAKLHMRNRGEEVCRELGMQYIHTRIFSAYGPGDHPWTLVESCLKAFKNGETLSLGQCTQQWNFIYIDDLARAMCALTEVPEDVLSGESPVFNLAGEETRPLRTFVEEIRELCGGTGTAAYATRTENAEGVIHLIPDISKLKRVTGWNPQVDFAAGIRKMLNP